MKQSKVGTERISLHVAAVNFLLKSYATVYSIAKATAETAYLIKNPIKTSVQFAEKLCTMAAHCGNAYLEKRTKEMFIDGLPATTQSALKSFWDYKLNTSLLRVV